MAFCSDCQSEFPDNSSFCGYCGGRLIATADNSIAVEDSAGYEHDVDLTPPATQARVPVYGPIFENPFALIGLPVDASVRDIRERIERMEMDARLGVSREASQAALTRARQMLADAHQRIECELLGEWVGSESYGHCAEDHDYALGVTKIVLDRSRGGTPHDVARAIRAWAGVVAHPDVQAAVNARATALGLDPANDPLAEILGRSIIPALVSHSLDGEPFPEPDIARAVTVADIDVHASAEVIAQHVERVTGDSESMDALTVEEVSDLVDNVIATAEELEEAAPHISRRMVTSLATAVNATAWVRANDGDLTASEAILADLASSDLPEAERVETMTDLTRIREALTRSSATPSGGGGSGPAIIGTEGLTVAEVIDEVERGGRFVIFEYVMSFVIFSTKRPSDVYFIKAGENPLAKGWGFVLITLILGWWGIAGFFWTLGALYTNLSGGRDVTAEVMATVSTQVGRS